MLRRVFFTFAIGFVFAFPKVLMASWQDVYDKTKDAYIDDVGVEDLAVAALKGLHRLDKELMVANDSRYVTLYYRGKVVKALRKPKDEKDARSWENLTENIIRAAVEISEKASERDFQIEGILAGEMVSVLDKDSKYYPSFDAAEGIEIKNHRVFAARQEGSLLFIKIRAFNKQTTDELRQALQDFHQAKAIVIDLRACPGGMSSAAVNAADLFLTEGIIVSTQGKAPAQEIYYVAKKEAEDETRPVFVLVDGKTASAAEIFTSALQEQGRARVIGTQSKGKGTLQKLIALTDGGVLAITNSFFRTPAGHILNRKGVTPSVCTFEQKEDANINDLLEKGRVSCSQEDREDSLLEMNIVNALSGSLYSKN